MPPYQSMSTLLNHGPFAVRRERVERSGTGSRSLCRAERFAKGRVTYRRGAFLQRERVKSSTGSEAMKARRNRATEAGGRAATERKAHSLPGTEWRDGNGPGAS